MFAVCLSAAMCFAQPNAYVCLASALNTGGECIDLAARQRPRAYRLLTEPQMRRHLELIDERRNDESPI